jgi:hypothetical protein
VDDGNKAKFHSWGNCSRTFCFVCCQRNIKIKIYKNIILLVVFYECETSYIALREEPRLRAFTKRVLRKTLGLKWNEII